MLESLESGSVVASGAKGGETPGAVVSAASARQGDLAFAVGATLALHLLAFVFLVLLALAEILIGSRREEVPEPIPEKPREVIVELSPSMLIPLRTPAESATGEVPPGPDLPDPVEPDVAPVPQPEDEPAPLLVQRRGYIKTNEDQASEEAPEEASLIGERDTVAGSEKPPADAGPEVPNQDGEEQKREEMSLFDSDFSEGDDPGDTPSEVVEAERPAGSPEESAADEGAPAEVGDLKAEEPGTPAEPLVNSPNEVEVPVEKGEDDEALPKESEQRRESELAKRGEDGTAEQPVEEQPRSRGFRTEARKTKMEGTLNRRGRNSLNVENTAIGRYKGKINRIIENEWQRQCITHRNHILPGILTLRFFVDERGRVSGLRFIDEFHASEIQKGFTIQSIRASRFPPMPKDVAREMDGESLEFRLNFNF